MPTPRLLCRLILVHLPALVSLTLPANAQTTRDDPTDVQAWLGGSLTLDLPNRWETSLQYRMRLVDDASDYHGSYFTTEVSRNLSDIFSAMTSYRLALVDSATFHRFALGAEARREFGALQLRLRPTVQYQRQHFEGDDEQSTDSDLLIRARGAARYDLSETLTLHGAVEPYFTFADGEYPIDNIRNTVGLRWDFMEDQRIDLFYIYRPDFARSYNRTFHVIGLELDLTKQFP